MNNSNVKTVMQYGVPGGFFKAGMTMKSFRDGAEEDGIRVVNQYVAGWPYTRALDKAVVEYWKALSRYQAEHLLVAYRDGKARVFLHGELTPEAAFIHLTAMQPQAVEEAIWLLGQFEALVRSANIHSIIGPRHFGDFFYAGYFGFEDFHPHWAVEGTEAYVRAGYRIGDDPQTLMTCSLSEPIELDADPPAGYDLAPIDCEGSNYCKTSFGFGAFYQGVRVSFVYGHFYPLIGAPEGGAVGKIGPVGTEESHRNKGLANIMVKMCLHHLREMGASSATITTGLNNFPALRVYEKAGFERRYNTNPWVKEM